MASFAWFVGGIVVAGVAGVVILAYALDGTRMK